MLHHFMRKYVVGLENLAYYLDRLAQFLESRARNS